jgi:hypothetical protein
MVLAAAITCMISATSSSTAFLMALPHCRFADSSAIFLFLVTNIVKFKVNPDYSYLFLDLLPQKSYLCKKKGNRPHP